MEEKVILKTMKCPTCGASLKTKDATEAIVCVYCGNSIVPVVETPAATQQENSVNFSGVVKVEGIKTSSSALAYIEQFFEEFDWEAFAYAQTLSIREINKLTDSLKISSADDKNTWVACFKAASVPFAHKIIGCQNILAAVIEAYKQEDLDAYSKFDAYKRIAAMIVTRRDDLIADLEKMIAKAEKYGASSEEVNNLRAEVQAIQKAAVVNVYAAIEEIPAIKTFINEKNAAIVARLAVDGVDAESEYVRAKTLINEKKYVEALNILLSLKGYADSNALIKTLDKYFLISDVLEIEGTLYYFKSNTSEDGTLSLHPTEDGCISEKPLIKHILKIVTNHADILYYIDGSNRLRQFNLSTKSGTKIFDRYVSTKDLYRYKRSVFMLAGKSGETFRTQCDVVVLDLITGAVTTLIKDVSEIVSLTGNKMIYTVAAEIDENADEVSEKFATNIINVDTMNVVKLGAKTVKIEGFIDDAVVYTQASPDDSNRNLYIKAWNDDEPERLIEANIFKFSNIIAGQLFYYIGNPSNRSLITIRCDGTQRKEWPLYISELLFEQGGWLYFIRKAGYNSILCKARLDGSKFSVIAKDIATYIAIKNGYLYYINDYDSLVKVRMDGSNSQELCDDVETVLSVQENKIIFVSIDSRASGVSVKSIYAVDFSGSGKIKLAYNIKSAAEYDDNTVYYVAQKEIKASYDKLEQQEDVLYKLDVETNRAEKLLSIILKPTESKISGFAIAMIIMLTALVISIVSCSMQAFGLMLLSAVVGAIALIVGASIKFKKE